MKWTELFFDQFYFTSVLSLYIIDEQVLTCDHNFHKLDKIYITQEKMAKEAVLLLGWI